MAQAISQPELRPCESPRAKVLMFPQRLQPGSFVKLLHHPHDLPAFELIHCNGRRCWVRQQAWGSAVFWEVSRLSITADAS
ncbi:MULTISPECIES: hypothetical protein [Synechococcus]|jgi:hypothetical protein|uniref:hypothetical protein n=1 Tax=Synechococcus TaxID=1129 RepID=UPI0028F45FDD|nr:hypothetical protein [Synechococcus lacustris]